jgi:2'-5' RNA ligase
MTTPGSTKLRAFLAVELGADIRAALVRLKRELAARAPKVRWVRDEGLHATIKFLGSVAPAQLDAIREALTPVAGAFAPIGVSVRGLGVFPSPKRPRVVWVGLRSDRLARLAEAVELALEPLGFPREGRPFNAHVTLGRIDAPQAWAPLGEALEVHGNDDLGSSRIRELIAFRSQLQRGGAVYSRLWAIELEESREGGANGPGCQS